MIDPTEFIKTLARARISFYSGVPDSLLSSLIRAVGEIIPEANHIVAANEGSAVALACGYHLATGNIGVVYMQNSGLGNAINPLMSIADLDVYAIPMLLIIGWRGEPGVKDEPQHVKQGAVSEDLLKSLQIPFYVLDSQTTKSDIDAALLKVAQHEGPSAFLVRKDCFALGTIESASLVPASDGTTHTPAWTGSAGFLPASSESYSQRLSAFCDSAGTAGVPPASENEELWVSVLPVSETSPPGVNAGNPSASSAGTESTLPSDDPRVSASPAAFASGLAPLMSREDAIRFIQAIAPRDAIFVASTGKIGRELYEIRNGSKTGDRDFYCVGGMGHASQIALGIALCQASLVICLDGDGAALMHLGHLASIAALAPSNFMHIILNNRMHESVGGQPTTSPQADFAQVAKSLGYPATCRCTSLADLIAFFASMNIANTPILIEMLVAGGSRSDLARPKESPKERKIKFMKALRAGHEADESSGSKLS